MSEKSNSKFIYLVSIVAALGGLLFGYDTAVIAGAIGYLQIKFELTPLLTGWAASSAIWGCVAGAAFAGHFSDKYGRKKVMQVTAILFAISAVASALPQNLTQFVIARFIGGLGVGAASILSPLYISEIAPAKSRGMLVTLYQLAIVVGINIIYFVNLIIASNNSESWNIELGWRYMVGSEVIPAALFLFMLYLVPESPRWLTAQGREDEALKILEKVNGKEEAASVMSQVKEALTEETGTFRELFGPGLRMAMIVGCVLAVFSQITGINAIIYYAPEIFKSVGFGTESAMLQTVVIGVTNTIFTFVAIWLIDKAGRKKLLLWGVSGMIICLFGMGASFYFSFSSGYVLLAFVLGYVACFAASLGPIPWVIISEIFPTKTRGLAMSFCIVLLWLAVVLITQMTPVLLDHVGGAMTFWIFMVNAIILVFFVWKFVPETKQKTLEEIEHSWRQQ
ncbi:MAG: arabinose-proton symporter [Bacteroidetes bacterium]|nr:MAG: arabinose-proton symporter [Bacteroidota bacterium]